ncbi:ABC transporter substrate-binding protein [Nostoc sp. UHCC 0870]|uniref:ABC transporter substrate-binding protein n=1 Tax=Nostoc sp. UHCC 0870 TaxID=2914041 RepID=UPI001EDEE2E1|nr:ABC transporter substrate-binding protein [Nostoc sp. UHCC 0870]UKO96931.1 ABC transporter substrate-binding protein [Nostoc sp. UHCC 0870]
MRGIKQRLLLTVLVITIISACSSTKIKHNETLTIESSLTPCRVVQHAMGEACIPDHPKRVITISSYAALLGDTLALGINPIGNTVYIDEELRKSYLVDKINGIKLIGDPFNPNLEKILLLKPDLILAWDNVERIYPILSKIAPTVIFSWKDRIAGNWKESFNFTAEIFRKKAVAQQVLSNYHHRVEELKWLSQSSYARIA